MDLLCNIEVHADGSATFGCLACWQTFHATPKQAQGKAQLPTNGPCLHQHACDLRRFADQQTADGLQPYVAEYLEQ